MERNSHFKDFFDALRHIASHAGVTLLAVGIAFSLPALANYILFTWWPMVASNSQLLMINEIIFAGILVLLFNLLLKAKEARLSHRMNSIALLVDVREEGSCVSGREERSLLEHTAGARDVSVLSVTGFDTFVSEMRSLRQAIDACFELRVLLMNPYGPGAKQRAQSLGDTEELLDTYRRETEATIERLEKLEAAGKKVTLKFYDEPPFWNVIVTGDHARVQYCHHGQELKTQPEYVFARSRSNPAQGLFPAFYVHFLNNWNDRNHPEYDFSTRQLVYRNERGNEVKRVGFLPQPENKHDRSLLLLAG